MSGGFVYTIKAHETIYKGVKFRSRLEARWAAFFDIVGWGWEYEPLDLDGWVPDFLIQSHYGDIFCEVKPITEMKKYLYMESSNQVLNKIKKVSKETENLCLLLGSNFFEDEDGPTGGACIGASFMPGDETEYDFAILIHHKKYGFCDSYGSWTCKITGVYEGNCMDFVDIDRAKLLWNEAGNITRWNPKG